MSICPADSVRPATQHVMYFDLLNVCAAIGVVYLHCNGMVHTFREGGNWVIGLAIECIFYWSVPIFFMLTGATLIGYRRRYDTRTYLIRRVLRVIVPFVAWSLIWYLLLPSVNDGSINAVDFLKKFLSGQIISIYWFFYPLIGIYLSMPLLSLLDGKYRLQEYLIGATFLLQSVIYPLCKQFGFEIGEPFVVSSASSHVMLIILGNWLANNELTRRRRIYIYGLGIFGLMYRFVFTLISSETMGYVDKTWFTYCGFPSVFLAVAVFVWFKYHDWTRLKIASKRIATLASCSFGVYLIHYEVLHQICFERMGISGLSITFRLFGALLLYFAVATGVYIAKNIPLLKRIVP